MTRFVDWIDITVEYTGSEFLEMVQDDGPCQSQAYHQSYGQSLKVVEGDKLNWLDSAVSFKLFIDIWPFLNGFFLHRINDKL